MNRVPFRGAVTGLLTLTLTILLMGCAANRQARTQAMLESSLYSAGEDFWDAIRWERYDAATVHAADRAAWLAISDALLDAQGEFRVTDYTIIAADVVVDEESGASGAEGEVLVRFELTTLPSMSLERRTWAQQWKRVSGQWRLSLEGDEARLFLPENR